MIRRTLWYGESDAISNAIGYAKFYSRSHDAVVRVYDEAGNVIETHEQAGESSTSTRLGSTLTISGERDAPALVRDSDGRVRCVACQLCEFICPPRAIKIIPGEIPSTDRFARVEKYPEEFDIDMIRCIFCGMCEEVCPEQAIFLRKEYAITGFTRADMVHHKEKLLEIGGVMHGVVLKWNEKK